MKKIIVFIFGILMCLTSCTSIYKATANMNYDVCYPDTTITYNNSVEFNFNVTKSELKLYGKNYTVNDYLNDFFNIYAHSYNGTNYLSIKENNSFTSHYFVGNIISTTAPIRVNKYSFNNITKIKRNKSRNQKNKTVKFKKEL